jgi:hypothetical protein
MGIGKSTGNPTVDELRKLGMVEMNITMADGSERKAGLSKAGNKWARLAKLLDELPWVIIEAMDVKGTIVGRIEADAPDDDEGPDDEGGQARGVERMSRIMLEVMRTTLKETRSMFQAQMDGQAALIQAMVEGMRAQSDSYALALKIQAAQVGGEGGSSEVSEMMRMGLALAMQPRQMPPPQAPKVTP